MEGLEDGTINGLSRTFFLFFCRLKFSFHLIQGYHLNNNSNFFSNTLFWLSKGTALFFKAAKRLI